MKYMIENLNYDKSEISWFNKKEIKLKIEKIEYASYDKINNYIRIEIGAGFISEKYLYYDVDGNKIMECNAKEEFLWWKIGNVEKIIRVKNLIYVPFYLKKKIIIIQTEDENKIFHGKIFNLKGEFLFEVIPPPDFTIWYFSEDEDGVYVACDGDKKYADSSGRTSYNFKIDLSNGVLSKVGLAY